MTFLADRPFGPAARLMALADSEADLEHRDLDEVRADLQALSIDPDRAVRVVRAGLRVRPSPAAVLADALVDDDDAEDDIARLEKADAASIAGAVPSAIAAAAAAAARHRAASGGVGGGGVGGGGVGGGAPVVSIGQATRRRTLSRPVMGSLVALAACVTIFIAIRDYLPSSTQSTELDSMERLAEVDDDGARAGAEPAPPPPQPREEPLAAPRPPPTIAAEPEGFAESEDGRVDPAEIDLSGGYAASAAPAEAQDRAEEATVAPPATAQRLTSQLGAVGGLAGGSGADDTPVEYVEAPDEAEDLSVTGTERGRLAVGDALDADDAPPSPAQPQGSAAVTGRPALLPDAAAPATALSPAIEAEAEPTPAPQALAAITAPQITLLAITPMVPLDELPPGLALAAGRNQDAEQAAAGEASPADAATEVAPGRTVGARILAVIELVRGSERRRFALMRATVDSEEELDGLDRDVDARPERLDDKPWRRAALDALGLEEGDWILVPLE